MSIIPPYLKRGDTIGILCPGGFMPLEKASACINTLNEWGYKVIAGKTLGHQFNYFSGTDEERLKDLQDMLDDKDINAILCARGGYGMGRIIDLLDFESFKKHPKWIIGFSDITLLQSHVFSNFKIASMHAPMAAAFNNKEFKNQYVQSLRDALLGKKASYTIEGHLLNRKGKATEILVGGNLSLLAHASSTRSELKTKNKILFIEEVGEYIYSVDRMMYQLKRSGQLDHLKGLIIGRFTDMKDTAIPFGQSIEGAIRDVIKEFDYPVCFGFPVGHQKENYALKIGGKYKFSVEKDKVELKEL